MNALDPVRCGRCRRTVTHDDPERPEWIDSRIFAPANPRPMMPGGTRADGTVIPPSEVWWMVEADSAQRGTICLLLCHGCVLDLRDWAYGYVREAAAAAV